MEKRPITDLRIEKAVIPGRLGVSDLRAAQHRYGVLSFELALAPWQSLPFLSRVTVRTNARGRKANGSLRLPFNNPATWSLPERTPWLVGGLTQLRVSRWCQSSLTTAGNA
jgi:hypothetical protein